MRAAFATTAQLWRSASMNPYRADWILLAYNNPEKDVFNNYIKKTGLAWFIRCNRNRATFGLAPVLAAPAWAAVGDPGSLSAYYDPGPPETFSVSATQPPGPAEAVLILATRALSPGILTLSNQQRIIFTENPGTSGPWDILAAWKTKFGAIPPDKQIFVMARYIDTTQGRAGLNALTSATT